jgi:hypothetical protein
MRVDSSLQGTNTKTLEGSRRRLPLPRGGFPPNPHHGGGRDSRKELLYDAGTCHGPGILISRHRQYPQSLVGPRHRDVTPPESALL